MVALLGSGCTQGKKPQRQQAPAAYPELLIVFPNAQKAHFSSNEWGERAYYIVKEDYPATNVLTSVSQVLAQNGWTALEYDFLNPDIPSSHVRGWGHFFQTSRNRPKMDVHQWMAQWEKGGDIVWYTLRYEYPVGEKDLSTLYVSASYTSAPIAKKYLE
jgi:hypothetical protein